MKNGNCCSRDLLFEDKTWKIFSKDKQNVKESKKKGAKRRGKEIINKLPQPFAPQLFTTTFWPLLRQFQRNLRHNVWSHPRQPKNEQFSQLSIKRGMTICFVLNFMRKKFRRGQKGGTITWQNQNSGLTRGKGP